MPTVVDSQKISYLTVPTWCKQMAIILFLYIFFIIISAYIDAEHINDKDFIEDHKSRWIQRLIITLGFAFDDSNIYFFDWNLILIFSLLFISIFDSALNYFREVNIFYLGTVAKWDIFWSKKKGLYIALRILSIITTIILIIYYYEKNK